MNSENDKNNFALTNDTLVEAAVELANELGRHDIPLILGGGLSLYIRTKYLQKKRSPRYKSQIITRSTKDIDVFLTGDLIIDTEKVEALRDTLTSLGYLPKTPYFQFEKEIRSQQKVSVDILSSPTVDGDDNRDIRIKPGKVKKFHARRNNEAKGISIGLIPITNITDRQEYTNLYIVSSFNYIILKLHAFRDRLEDPGVDFGRYHAYDIFATVIDMDESDWINAGKHFEAEREQAYIVSASEIVKHYFSKTNDLGILRLKENELYRRGKEEFDTYIQDFLNDLKDMFKL